MWVDLSEGSRGVAFESGSSMSVGKKLKNMFGGGEEEDLTLEREETDDDDSKGFLTDSMQSVSMCPPMNNNCFFCFVGIVQLRES